MLEPGVKLQNRYLIRHVIGRGGMGTVYLAEQIIFAGRKVAIKQMDSVKDPHDAQKYAAQFLREAQLLGSLQHPGLVEVKDYFEEEGTLYLVMEYVEGDSLETLLRARREPFAVDTVVAWMDQVLGVLEYLHQHDPPVIFQDLKPGNLMLSKDGRLRLIDFGIARTVDPSNRTLTLVRTAGTPGYASPEQHGGMAGVTSDIYSAGATMYALLGNAVPPPSLHLLLGSAELAELSVLNPQVPPAVEAVVYTMMALLASNRYQTADEARKGLQEALRQPQDAPGGSLRLRHAARQGAGAAGIPPPAAPHGFRISKKNDGLVAVPGTSGELELKVRRPTGDMVKSEVHRPVHRACPGCGTLLESGQICKRCLPDLKTPVVVQPQPAPLPEPPTHPSDGSENSGERRRRSLFRSAPSSALTVPFPSMGRESDAADTLIQLVSVTDVLLFNAIDWYALEQPLRFSISWMKDNTVVSQCSAPLMPVGLLVTPSHWRYTAHFLQDPKPEMIRYLKAFEGPLEVGERRAEQRLECKFRVTSPDLPQYQAISTDISRRGLSLLTKGPVQVGHVITLRLDFDDDRFAHVLCKNQVRWCYYGLEGEYRIGTLLQEITAPHAAIFGSYLDFLGQHKERWKA